jgi:hypothetical protein
MIKQLISSIILSILFQTPVSGSVNLSDNDIYYHGKILGVLYCVALESGAKTTSDVIDIQEKINDADINLAGKVYASASTQQKKIFVMGFTQYTSQECPNEINRFNGTQ